MNKKLHRVEVVLYLMAEDEFDACWAATNVRFEAFECVAQEAERLDPGWEDAVPYNADDDRTCSEILMSQMQAGRSGAKSIKSSAAWSATTSVSPIKNSSGKRPRGPSAKRPRSRDFISRLFGVTRQDLKDAAIDLQRMRG